METPQQLPEANAPPPRTHTHLSPQFLESLTNVYVRYNRKRLKVGWREGGGALLGDTAAAELLLLLLLNLLLLSSPDC